MNKLKTKFLIISIFWVGVLLVPTFLYAEPEIILQESDIDVQITPENPEPYQEVTIKLVSYATDLNKAMIEWRSGSSVVLSGYGKISYSFETFGANSSVVFDIKITPFGYLNSITKKVLVSPSEVDVFWESVDGYTPPFYRGKSFPSREGKIKVVAIPNTNVIKQGRGNITYNWKLNDETAQSVSGYNKDSFVFNNDVLNRAEEVTVLASSIDGKYGAVKNIEVPIASPKIIFYKKSPTEGVLYNQALTDDFVMSEEEMTVVAVPYFLAYVGNEYSFNYQWKINNEIVPTPSKKTEITIRPSSRGGYATIELYMENLKTLYQEVRGNLKINL